MPHSSPPSILVVDDEADICQNLADILQEFGYEVHTASCGAEALEKIRSRTFDVALLDLKMPGMDGVTLYKTIREQRGDIVSLIVTAYANPQTIKDALHAGVWQVLSKPVDLQQLLTFVSDAVEQPLVMVVDDDVDLCHNLWDVFRARGMRSCTAHTEQEALQRISERQFEVILVDLKLPTGDGRHVLEKIRSTAPDTRAILITGHPEELLKDAEPTPLPDAICYKPFEMSQLLETIERFARRTR
ncbi:response regulator [Planctomicrobium piriforme]|uniref:Response regulator receiver domain-containing protein n=1 Tax=Planctomicrobium piriforme TaxID=1576369 RepID=A0A1I3B3Z0_9PLAN|nr:response regulator [Planctomicrobium piriforme]SFH57003.1 Response regulator receiver domain-containing protein [Planctomicrobium piriforme]